MATASATLETFADLQELLGHIPPQRIRLRPAAGLATEADVLAALRAPRKRLCELIEGVLVEKPMGYTEAILETFLLEILNAFVRSHNLGLVSGASGTIRLWEGRVRIPDVTFVSWDRLPNRQRPTEPVPDIVPDLAVEVLSDSNTAQEMELKRQDYFTAGVSLVWEVDPDLRNVTVYTSLDQSTVLDETATLDGDTVLPGFSLPVQDLFAELDRQG